MSNSKFILTLVKWIALILYLLFMLGFIRRERQNTVCTGVEYHIDSEHAFVDTTDMYELLVHDSLYPVQKPSKQLNLLEMEKCMESHEAVKNAEVYQDMNGLVHVSVMQRNPVLRIITETNMHYYVDESLGLMSVGYEYTADVPVLSGNVPDTLLTAFRQGNDTLVFNSMEYSMRDIISFADYVYHDEFWRDLFVQIYINQEFDIEIVPRVGNFIILLGKPDNYQYKLKKLKAMYEEGFPKYGWKDYKYVNLKYSNQVVCSK